MSSDDKTVPPVPGPDLRRLMAKFDQLPEKMQLAVQTAAHIAVLFERLPEEHRVAAAKMLEALASVSADERDVVVRFVNEIVAHYRDPESNGV